MKKVAPSTTSNLINKYLLGQFRLSRTKYWKYTAIICMLFFLVGTGIAYLVTSDLELIILDI